MIWDTKAGTLQVLDRRIDKLKKTMSEIQLLQIVYIRKLHSFVGQIISLSLVSGNITRLMTRHCQIQIAKATEEDEMINFDVQCKSDFTFWKENLNQLNKCKVFETHNVNKIICCDDSATGSGAIICNDIHIAHKLCTELETMQSSTRRELNTMEFAIKSFIPIIAGSQLKIFTDSQAAARVVEVGSMKIELQKMALDIFTTCTRNNIKLEVQWIPRNENEQADFISRLIDTDDWIISEELFHTLNDLWGPYSIDCFACYYNTKLPRFFSRFWNPDTSGVDAFSQNWSRENCLLVPPVTLIPSVLKHIYWCKGKGTLIFPWWPSSVFWPLLLPWVAGCVSFEGLSTLEQGRKTFHEFNGLVCAVYTDFTINA